MLSILAKVHVKWGFYPRDFCTVTHPLPRYDGGVLVLALRGRAVFFWTEEC
jgi:hypothetical protein